MFHFLHAILRYSGELKLSENESKATQVLSDLFTLTNEIQRDLDKRAREHGISYGQYTLLHLLLHQSGRRSSPSTLADWLGVSRPAVSAMIDALEKDGYVRRELDERDRRGMVISLTEAGYSKVEEMNPRFLLLMNRFISEFGQRDVDDLLQSLDKLKKGFAKLDEDEAAQKM